MNIQSLESEYYLRESYKRRAVKEIHEQKRLAPRHPPLRKPPNIKQVYPIPSDMSVCIAARSIITLDRPLVLCMDMLASTDFNSAEITFKWHMLSHGFRALLAGPIPTAREMADCCRSALSTIDISKDGIPHVRIPSDADQRSEMMAIAIPN